ncbi:MAG: ion transporter [Ignavibacterium sp.]|nr:ion transporter [Ignavibacterium sp.]
MSEKIFRPPDNKANWRIHLYEIIFEADTRKGKFFDIILLWCIMLSIIVVFLESIGELGIKYSFYFHLLEWIFTILFSIEYIFRLLAVKRPLRYALSFYGVIDLLAIIPTYLSLIITGGQYFIVIRVLRLLRVFRIFKIRPLLAQAEILTRALKASRGKIAVFLFSLLTVIVVIGTIMYVIEGPENGFTSIPTSMYWAVVTLTTVGYGDIAPQTPIGQILASFVMILGYAIIAVPTGIVTVEIAEASRKSLTTQVCPECLKEGHDKDAVHCKYCGVKL